VNNRGFQRLTSNPTLAAAASLTSTASGTLVASIKQLITGLISTQPRFKPKMMERTSDMLAKMNASINRGFPIRSSAPVSNQEQIDSDYLNVYLNE